MANATLESKCPICGEDVKVRANCDPGEPATGMSGPYEHAHPGSGPSIDEFEEAEYECECLDKILENAPYEKRAVYEQNEYQGRMRQILIWQIPYITSAMGFKARKSAITHTVQLLAGACQPRVHKRNVDGTWAYEDVCPLADAYEEAVFNVAADSTIEFDEWEPWVPEYE